MSKVDLSIVLASYNEGPTFEISVRRILTELEKTKRHWEIIFVEDKSTDETATTVHKLLDDINNSPLRWSFGGQAKAIFHKKNMGRGKSVADGIMAARGDICGYLDVDLEVSANYIPLFVDEIEKGSDMVVGKRFYEGGFKSLTRFAASKIYAFVVNFFLKIPVADTETGYKFFNRAKILPVLVKVRDNHWFWDTEICVRSHLAGLKIGEVPVLFVRRDDKKSTVRLIPDTIDYIKKIVKFRKEIAPTFK